MTKIVETILLHIAIQGINIFSLISLRASESSIKSSVSIWWQQKSKYMEDQCRLIKGTGFEETSIISGHFFVGQDSVRVSMKLQELLNNVL